MQYNMSQTIENIRPAARLLKTIGQDLIKDVYAAIVELVKYRHHQPQHRRQQRRHYLVVGHNPDMACKVHGLVHRGMREHESDHYRNNQ